jgi:hippurate hydrolase
MLLGAAKYLALEADFDGTVNVIFQPGEEGIGGALAMLKDGLFERFPCDAIYALHNRPGMEVGTYCINKGPSAAGGAFFDIVVTGRGAHGARPEGSIDPVLVASHITTALQSIVSRNVPPSDTAVLSVTRMDAGDAYNVIAQSAVLRGTARTMKRATMDLLEGNVKRLSANIAEAFDASASTDFRFLFAPLVNDVAETAAIARAAAAVVGADNVETNGPQVMASEDFSFMLEAVPGAYINIGNGDTVGSCQVHNENYEFNDAAIPFGSAMFASLVEQKLPAGAVE